MFSTFSGSSRKPRNVNLSGQRNVNPFANSTWGATPSAGPSKTIADAQADRRQRQHERERRQAAHCIQRTWRGHKVRRSLWEIRRQDFDQSYGQSHLLNAEERLIRGLPLLLTFFTPSRADDRQRLQALAQDLLDTSFGPVVSGRIHYTRLSKLGRILLAALERNGDENASMRNQTYLKTFIEIVDQTPKSVEPLLSRYYTILARYCRESMVEPKYNELLLNAILGPLRATSISDPFTRVAYWEFAKSFLTQHDIRLFEQNVTVIAKQVSIDALSAAIMEIFSKSAVFAQHQDDTVWLVAHFIAIQRSRKGESAHLPTLKTLYMLLSTIASQIRKIVASQGAQNSSKDSTYTATMSTLDPYVVQELTTLVDKDGIADLLDKFTSNYSGTTAADFEAASLLAGYTLTLLRCFPASGDDIRMRLYLADILTPSGRIPAVKFFWDAVSKTSVFSIIKNGEDACLDLMRSAKSQSLSSSHEDETTWNREWRTVLLFLELYVFVLRLTDDEDFFANLGTSINDQVSTSRLRQSALTREELMRLTLFLKHLGFTLFYNSAQLFQVETTNESSGKLENFLASPSRFGSAAASGQAQRTQPFTVIAGIDINAFRSIVTAAMRMLYERDSRRTFLPKGHWLMTSKFDMQGFLSAVVLEAQRQQELRGAGEDDEDEDHDEDEMDVDGHQNLTFAGQRRSRYAQVEMLRAQQRQHVRERMLAAIGPKLEVLRNMPFVIPFDTRVQIFRQFVHLDKERRRGGNIDPDRWRMWVLSQHGSPFDHNSPGRDILGKHHAQIQRGQVFQDALSEFYELGEGLKEPIQITFVDRFGTVEAGIDGGGVTKEFLTSVTNEAFTDQQSLFVTNNKNAFYPNPCAVDQRSEMLRQAKISPDSEAGSESMADLLRQYEFLGRIIGKCMYEGILIDIVFAGFFLLKWSSSASDSMYRANINDLREMDDELYQGMLRLKSYPGNVSDLGLDFTIEDQVSLAGEAIRTVTRNLIPNGDHVPVTNENRPLYTSYVARHRLAAQPHLQTRAFLRGLGLIIDPAWLGMFNQSELQRLVGGDSSEIDVEDLRSHTVYSGVYSIGDDGLEHPTVALFWEVMKGLADHERRDVLKYVTSTPRAPLLGFGQLSPPFSIRDGGQDQERLPSASTCVNLLKLPQYRTAATLKSKLLYAVSSGAGFDLS